MDWEASGSGDNGVPQTVSTPDGKPPKGKKKWPIVLAVLVILIIAARISSCVGGCSSSGPSKTVETFTWPSSGLATELPKPKTNKGEIYENSSESFSATLKEVSQADYDSYVEFMKKYESSDDTASMLADYGSMMQQYSDWSQKFDSVDESSLSAEDQAYYLEVQGRVLQKLSEVQ